MGPAVRDRITRLVGSPGPGLWIGLAVGAPIVVWAAMGFQRAVGTEEPNALRWFVGGALALDLAVVPVAAMVGWVVRRLVPAWAWPAARAALIASAAMIAYAWPLVLGEAGPTDNKTVRPRDYQSGIIVALGATWLAAAALAMISHRRSTRSRARTGWNRLRHRDDGGV